jgi:16S rRNA (guanine527-N7)-methyltransferase
VSDAEVNLRKWAATILGRPLAETEASALWAYLDLLETWNRVHRLIGSSDRRWMVEHIILDSLLFLAVLPGMSESLLDIGSGAGVPGIPIGIVRPEVSIVLVESRRKRVSFLATVIRELGLSRTEVVHGRAEGLISGGRRFDAVVARCAGAPKAVLDLGSYLVSPGGCVVIAGSPRVATGRDADSVAVANPMTGSPRHFLVRRAPPE